MVGGLAPTWPSHGQHSHCLSPNQYFGFDLTHCPLSGYSAGRQRTPLECSRAAI